MQVKKQQWEPDMEQEVGSKLGKEYIKIILSPCLFNLYAEYIMRNSRLDEAQVGIKIAGRNINNLRYADDTTLIKWKSENAGLKLNIQKKKKLNIQKTKIMASGPITSWQIDGKHWKQLQTLFSWAPKSLQRVTSAMQLKDACSLEEKLWPNWRAY